ncbi:MAG: hypothetical protein JW790_06300 [Dehalococcoidales bacterium]|nr:hypothetical protein [Dehalococcoidales bacterium]
MTPFSPALSAPDEVSWAPVEIPTEGPSGNWVLARNSDVRHLTVAADGALYAYAAPSGTSRTLFKSEDEGHSWFSTGNVTDEIVDIAADPEDGDTVCYATSSRVYKSSDGGISFTELPPNPGGAGSNNITITAIDIARRAGHHIIAAGTRDADSSQYGGIYLLDDEAPSPAWTNTGLGSYDVYSLTLSPNFTDDEVITAAVSDEAGSYVAYNYGSPGDWNTVELLDTASASFTITGAADPGLTADFSAPYPLFIGVAGGDGGIYEVDESHAQRLSGIDADIISLDLAGGAGTPRLVAGERDSGGVWYSSDGGASWDTAAKAPSGDGPTHVVIAEDFLSNGRAYAATSGHESAVSVTSDGGATWNQTGLIDTTMSTILDLAPSPEYHRDETLFLLTWGGEHSLWRSLNGGSDWERVFVSSLPGVDILSLVSLSPGYGDGSRVVFLAGAGNGSPALWKSSDNGQHFHYRGDAPGNIDAWAVVNDDTLFLAGYDGASGLIYLTTNGGQSYTAGTEVGSNPLYSIALSPDYGSDETILAGNTNGWVYRSTNRGVSFAPLPADAALPPLNGSVAVALDTDTAYAASDTPGQGIYRFSTGESTDWEEIASPAGARFGQLVVSAEGALYAANLKGDGGLERCLNPGATAPDFETVNQWLEAGATLNKLRLGDGRLWAIDTTNVSLVTLVDSLAAPVTLSSPDDRERGVGTLRGDSVRNVELDWEVLSGATKYEWRLNDDDDLDEASVLFEGSTGASAKELPDLAPATRYYWRVRASEPLLSRWSEVWSFTTAEAGEVKAPELVSPEDGASGVDVRPGFQWRAVAEAEGYELVVSSEDSGHDPVILKTDDYCLSDTDWECNISLEYDTAYYWKVRAVTPAGRSDWSKLATFTTIPEPVSPPGEVASPGTPVPPEAAESPPKSPPPALSNTPTWTEYALGALITSLVTLSVVVVLLLRKLRRRPP